MDYLIVIIVTWIINGSTKFAVNFLCHKGEAVSLIGYGGFPSTHTAIVTSLLSFIGFTYGFDHPAIAALAALLWVVVNDAKSLRMRIGEHAKHLNQIAPGKHHRERIGHKFYEICGGALVGSLVGYGMTIVL